VSLSTGKLLRRVLEELGARDLGFAVGLTSSLGQQAKNAVVGLAGLPIAVIKGLIKLVEDSQGTVEATLAKIKALPAYVKHAPAAFKEHINTSDRGPL
jgi:hypothetical protein